VGFLFMTLIWFSVSEVTPATGVDSQRGKRKKKHEKKRKKEENYRCKVRKRNAHTNDRMCVPE